MQRVANSADCLQINGICGICFDLLPQAIDLHVDASGCSFCARLGKIKAINRLSCSLDQLAKQITLAGCQSHGFAITPKF
jgi:hypothetical protein